MELQCGNLLAVGINWFIYHLHNRIKCLYILIITFLICSCDKVGMKQSGLQGPSEWVTAKVAVVLPLSGEDSDKERYERISRMFEENVIKAQYNLSEGVKLLPGRCHGPDWTSQERECRYRS